MSAITFVLRVFFFCVCTGASIPRRWGSQLVVDYILATGHWFGGGWYRHRYLSVRLRWWAPLLAWKKDAAGGVSPGSWENCVLLEWVYGVFQGELSPRRLPSSWISSTHFVFQSDDGGLAVLDTRNFTVSLLVTNHTLVSEIFLSL